MVILGGYISDVVSTATRSLQQEIQSFITMCRVVGRMTSTQMSNESHLNRLEVCRRDSEPLPQGVYQEVSRKYYLSVYFSDES